MRRALHGTLLAVVLSLAGCGGRGAVGGDASPPRPDAGDASSAADTAGTAGMIHSLVLTLSDGSPVPPVIGHGTFVAITVTDSETKRPVPNATWTPTGVCTLESPPGATRAINQVGFGDCTLTVTAAGLEGKVTFTYVVVDSVSFEGDTSPFRIGETRTYTITVSGPSARAADAAVEIADPPKSPLDEPAFDVQRSGRQLTLTAGAVGGVSVLARAGQIFGYLNVRAVASSIQISATASHYRIGEAFEIVARTFGPGGAPCRVADGSAVYIPGGSCLGMIGVGQVYDGLVRIGVEAGSDDCTVIATDGVTMSNPLPITVEKVASVKIVGPPDPVTVGQTVTLYAVPLDAAGKPFERVIVSWVDEAKSDIYNLGVTGRLDIRATIAKPGTARIVASVYGVSSQPFVSRAVPASISVHPTKTDPIAVGERTALIVHVNGQGGFPIYNATLPPLSLKAGVDGAPPVVSFEPSFVSGTDVTFVATGLTATGPEGVPVIATWTDGQSTFDSEPVELVVK